MKPILLTLALLVPGQETPVIGSSKGQAYPDFLLPNIEGGFGRLSDFRGKKVLVVNFASW